MFGPDDRPITCASPIRRDSCCLPRELAALEKPRADEQKAIAQEHQARAESLAGRLRELGEEL